MTSFASELTRRNVPRVAATYALVAWILIEAGSVLLPTFGAPEWFFKAYVILVAAGFVVALIFAWIFEITPDGVKLDRNVDHSASRPSSHGGKNYVIIGLLVAALGISITFNITGMRGDALDLGEKVVYDSIAVLPFTSRSTLEENQFFADGIHDDILTRLAEIKSLRVISRTSVNEYRDTTRNLRKIGEELGVASIVEGAVQRSGDQVRITVQLIDAATDEHIWARTYDRELTIESLFEVQSEISSQIASSLRAALTPEQEVRLAATPTRNLDAYAEYVAGRKNLMRREFTTLLQAREQFERAVVLDPTYAQAHAALAETVLITLANHQSIAREEVFAIASAHLDKALQIDPDLAEAHAAKGLMQMSQWESTRSGPGNLAAAASFEKALALNPNLADAYVWYSSLRRTEGEISQAIDLLTKALTVDPLSRIPYVNLPSLLAVEGQLERTTELLLHAIKLFPEWEIPYEYLSNHMLGLGRLDESVAWGNEAMRLSDDPMRGGPLIGVYQTFGDSESITEFIEAFPDEHPLLPIGKGYWQFVERDYEGALATFHDFQIEAEFPVPFVFPLMAAAAIMIGDYDLAYDTLRQGNPILTSDSENPVDQQNVASAVLLAHVEQQRNHTEAANRLLEQAASIVSNLPRLGMGGHGIRDVQILTMQGRPDAAIEALAEAVEEGFVSSASFDVWEFDINPIIEPLRSDPRFDVIRERMYERIEEMRRNVDEAKTTGDWEPLRARANSA
jgi:TolB-like protein/tetratricopeptide (TPR) repeat protein